MFLQLVDVNAQVWPEEKNCTIKNYRCSAEKANASSASWPALTCQEISRW